MRQCSIPILLCLGISPAAFASDFETDRFHNWHQWRGPDADGVAPNGDPPVHWDEQTNIRWKIPLPGSGSSTPIVWQDHVFLLLARESDRAVDHEAFAKILQNNDGQRTEPPKKYLQYVVLDIERDTGNVRWERVACEAIPHEGRHKTNTFASASPTTDGRFVYASFGSRGIYCYDFDGNLKWKRDLGDMKTRRGWGEGVSPALYQQTLLVNWDQENDSHLFALNAVTGKTVWQVERDEVTSWSTPLVAKTDNNTQVIVSATNRVRSYDLATANVLWETGGQQTNVIACPVRMKALEGSSDSVVCMSSYGASTVDAIPLDARGDITGTDNHAWQYKRMAPYCSSPLLYRQRLYFVKGNSTLMTSLDAGSGETVIPPTRLPLSGSLYASPVAAADRIYVVDRDGTTAVLKHGDKLEVLGVNTLDDAVDASPAVAGKQLFLRGKKHLYCIETTSDD